METYRLLHHCDDVCWWFESPDIPGMTGGGASYAESRKMGEEAVRFALERDDVIVEHYVPEAARLVPAA